MGSRGPQRRPALAVVREGNPHGRKAEDLKGGVKLPPAKLEEPDWLEWFPAEADVVVPRRRAKETESQTMAREQATALRKFKLAEQAYARGVASGMWSKLTRALGGAGLLAGVDVYVLTDAAVCWARIMQCERDVSAHGLRQRGERGWQRNGSITSAKSYRDQFRFYVGQLGLSPAARDGINPDDPEGDADGESPFDA